MTALAAAIDLATASLVVVLVLAEPTRIWLAIGVAALAVGAAQQETLFGDDTALSATMIVVLAAIGSALAGGPVWLVAICGLLGGMNAEHIRYRSVRKLTVNSACTVVAAFVSAGSAWTVHLLAAPSVLEAAVGAVVAASVYWVVDNCLIAIVLTVVDGRAIRTQLRDLMRSETRMVPCAALGFLLGYAGQSGTLPALVIVFALVILIAASRFVVAQPAASMRARTTRWCLLLAVYGAAVSGAAVVGGMSALSLALIVGGAPLLATSAFALDRARPSYGYIAPVIGAVIVAAVFRDPAGIAVAFALSLAGGLGVAVARRASLTLAVAAGVAALATTATIALLSSHSESPSAELALGIAVGVAYLVGIHAVSTAALLHRAGLGAWRAAASMVRVDAYVFVFSGLLAGAGVTAVAVSTAIGVVVFGCTIVVFGSCAASRHARAHQRRLSDEQLLDVVQSAILMLPASRLGDGP